MHEQKILKLAKPLLRTWSSESHLMSMILLQEDSVGWILNNYINIYGRNYINMNEYAMVFFPDPNPEEKSSVVNAWVACPFLEVAYVSHNYVKNNYVNILEYILNTIE